MNKSFLRCRCGGRRSAAACWCDLCSLLYLFSLRPRVTFERARRREFAELVADHVLSDVDRNVTLAVVHSEGQPNHVRRNRRATRPGLDDLRPLAARTNPLDHLAYALIDPGTFFN